MIKNFLSIAKNKLLPTLKHEKQETEKELIYRKDGKTLHKIIEYNQAHVVLKIIIFDYFKPNKIKSVEEYSNGDLCKITNFSIIKSETEYEPKTGKKLKTYNYNIKNSSILSATYNYDLETQNISRLTIYRPDGLSIALIKEFNPKTRELVKCVNYKRNSSVIASVSTYEITGATRIKTTYTYEPKNNISKPYCEKKSTTKQFISPKTLYSLPKQNIAKLIDNLYKNNNSFSAIKVS